MRRLTALCLMLITASHAVGGGLAVVKEAEAYNVLTSPGLLAEHERRVRDLEAQVTALTEKLDELSHRPYPYHDQYLRVAYPDGDQDKWDTLGRTIMQPKPPTGFWQIAVHEYRGAFTLAVYRAWGFQALIFHE